MNPLAEFADRALVRSMGGNVAGEIPGLGKPWACVSFGHPGHNATTCIHCITNFMNEKGVKK
jgi:hypothetical protein